ncbi:hypothetical protein, partial [uncultured Muribaculum sp.]|uniref:hypothetical protein n=3 Tax=Muribaculum TaxID=1918540 RepID=UPI0025AF3435
CASLCRGCTCKNRGCEKERFQKIILFAMALKKFDVPDIDDAISEAKDDEQRKEETAHAEKIAYALEYFTKKSPDILKNMSDVISQLDARKFASILREELKNIADEMAHRFNSKIEPMVKRAESAERRISVPTQAAYIILATIVWLFIFLIMVIYANTRIQSDDLTGLIVLFFVALIISIIAVIYFTKKYKW